MGTRKAKTWACQSLTGIYSIDPSDEDYKDIIWKCKAIVGNTTWHLQRHVKDVCYNLQSGNHCFQKKANASEEKTKFSCIAEAHEPTRPRIESATKRIHEDHIAGRGQNSILHYNVVHKFIPMPQAMKIPDAKAAPTFEERTAEETSRQEDCARKAAWDLAKKGLQAQWRR